MPSGERIRAAARAGAQRQPGGRWRPTLLASVLTPTDDPDAARRQVRDGDLSGLLEVRRAASDDLEYDYISNDSMADASVAAIRQVASGLAISDRLDRAGVAAQDKGAIFAPVAFKVASPDPNAVTRTGGEFGAALCHRLFFVLLNFIAVMNYGNWVAGSVAEEKSSRVMELLITAATSRQLLLGKLLGTCAAALTQYGALIAALVVGFLRREPWPRLCSGRAASTWRCPG